MDGRDQLKQDVRQGRVDVDRLIDIIVTLQRQLEAANRQHEAAQQRIAELEKKQGGAGGVGGAATAKEKEAFSVRAEEKRQEKRGPKKANLSKPKKGRRGRLNSADKVKLAERTESIFPEGVSPEDCQLSHTRPVWRLEKGRAVLVAYAIYRDPNNRYGKIPGVLGRSEFGLEIVVEIAYLVYVTGLSFDKVCSLLQFLQQLRVRKTQADRLLRQLSRHWQHEFDVLCTLLANSLVVHADETSWSINSVWAFLSEKARLLFFGVHKDGDTLKQILDPETFAGLMISDDAATYGNFTLAQKCWAHLLRKAIKLTLAEPANSEYRAFTDGLLAIYRRACRVQKDKRLNAAGRARKVALLDDELLDLCAPLWSLDLPPLEESPENDYRKLVNEVMRLMLDRQLFQFVTAEPVTQPNGVTQPVSGTNNEAERTLRSPAQARDTGRTSKTLTGARRQTIIVSVLESLRLYLTTFTLASAIAEIQYWLQTGQSCFSRLLHKLKLKLPPPPSSANRETTSLLDKVLPLPDG
jgi:transposase